METTLTRLLRKIEALSGALRNGNSLYSIWRARKGGLFRLPILYGNLNPDQEVVILDVGAGDGRSARNAFAAFPKATIHSFEPEPTFRTQLLEAAKEKPFWRVHSFALGSEACEKPFHVIDSHREASSLYRPSPMLKEVWPNSDFSQQHTILVPVRRLGDFIKEKSIDIVNIIKIDVQGAERDVLEGAGEKISCIQYIIVEVQFVLGYDKCISFQELHDFLSKQGFHMRAMAGDVRDKTGRMIHADILYGNDTLI